MAMAMIRSPPLVFATRFANDRSSATLQPIRVIAIAAMFPRNPMRKACTHTQAPLGIPPGVGTFGHWYHSGFSGPSRYQEHGQVHQAQPAPVGERAGAVRSDRLDQQASSQGVGKRERNDS